MPYNKIKTKTKKQQNKKTKNKKQTPKKTKTKEEKQQIQAQTTPTTLILAR